MGVRRNGWHGAAEEGCSRDNTWKSVARQMLVMRSMSSGVDLAADDDVADVRGPLGDGVDDRVAGARAGRPTCRAGIELVRAYWTKQLMTCLPGGAMVGSTVGMMRRCGMLAEAAVLGVTARSMYSTEGLKLMALRRCSPHLAGS